SDGSNTTQFFDRGWYAHASNHVSGRHDGNEFYLQMRVKRDPRRVQGGNASVTVGKHTFITICAQSLSDQELVTYSNGGGGTGVNRFRIYGGEQVFQALDQGTGGDGTIQPGGASEIWAWALDGTWDT